MSNLKEDEINKSLVDALIYTITESVDNGDQYFETKNRVVKVLSGYASTPATPSMQSSDAVEFFEWCIGQGYSQYAEFMPYYETPLLYEMFKKSGGLTGTFPASESISVSNSGE